MDWKRLVVFRLFLPILGVVHFGFVYSNASPIPEFDDVLGSDGLSFLAIALPDYPDFEETPPAANTSTASQGSRSVGTAEPEKKKKGGGVGGFLGLQNMLNPIIKLRRFLPGQDSNSTEEECTRTYFMGPYAKDITISANGSVGSRKDPTCNWNFIGTEPCIPLLTCDSFNLTGETGQCQDSLEVRDGNYGFQRFCGKTGPKGISAHGGLRDLYIKYKAHQSESQAVSKFQCTVTCSYRNAGTPLEKSFEPNVNPLCQCGKRPNQDFIVNGENATKQEFPWIAALVKAKTRQPFCGASIINDRSLLTAAHCFKGDYLQVANVEIVLGGHQLDVTPNLGMYNESAKPTPRFYNESTIKALDSGNGSVRFEIEEVVIHPLYVANSNDFDVAIVRLPEPIDFQKYPQLSPVCLPKLGSYLRTFATKQAIVAGWGLGGAEALGTHGLLQKLNVTVYTPKQCKDTYAHRINRRMMCAGYFEGGRDSCMGDSGGPLILEDSRHVWQQIGSVSWGEGCAELNNPGAYIRTTEVSQWLHHQSNLNDAVWCERPTVKPKATTVS